MRAINHAVTGALIGLTVSQPAVALPVALLSHFVLDAIPHHGARDGNASLTSRWFKYALYADAILCATLVVVLAISQPLHWLTAIFCAFLGAAPDLLSFGRYWATIHGRKYVAGAYSRFAHNIQWFEKPIGAVVEVAWLVAGLILLAPFVS